MVDRILEWGRYLRTARAQAKVKQKDLALALGIAPTFLHQIEIGKRPLPDSLIAKLPNEIRYSVISAAIGTLHEFLWKN